MTRTPTCKGRNVIERCYCRLKDFRRIATRYDKLASNFFSSACLVADWSNGCNLIESGPSEAKNAFREGRGCRHCLLRLRSSHRLNGRGCIITPLNHTPAFRLPQAGIQAFFHVGGGLPGGQMDWLRLLGYLVVIVLIGFIAIYIVFEIVARALDFAESNPLTVAVVLLIVLVIVLLSLKPGRAADGAAAALVGGHLLEPARFSGPRWEPQRLLWTLILPSRKVYCVVPFST
jgi:hypothetical protein